ncbi:MAG: hypothetical protein JW874_05565 [Spirochaetales bacterium]|nr:hypothetical protein [Spirochaetales bacterium]
MNSTSPLINRVHQAIDDDKVISFKTYKYLTPERYLVDRILERYLKDTINIDLKNKISYCIHEIAVNSKKANTKRVFFMEKGLDINNPDDYETGMRDFKDKTLREIGHYIKIQQKLDLHIRFHFRKKGNMLYVEVINNVPMNIFEEERIKDKFDKARKIQNMAEAYINICDYTEGSGLGIVMTILMLRSIGLSDADFSIMSKENHTFTQLRLDFDLINHESLASLA